MIYHLHTNPEETARMLHNADLERHLNYAALAFVVLNNDIPDPADYIKEWTDHEWTLIAVRNAARNERIRRGFQEHRPVLGQVGYDPTPPPWWMSEARMNESRRELLRQAEIHSLQNAARAYVMSEYGEQLTGDDAVRVILGVFMWTTGTFSELHEFFAKKNIHVESNYYEQYGWAVKWC